MSGLASDGLPLEAARPAIRGLVTARPGATGQVARLVLALLALLLLGLCVALAVSVGEMPVPLGTTVKALANRLLGAG